MSLADRRFERILLVKLSAIGDVIQTIPLLHALRRRYPQARIDWLSKPTPASFLKTLPGVDDVLTYGEHHTEAPQYNWDGIKHFGRLIRDRRFLAMLSRLRSTRYDLVVDMQGQMRSGFVTAMTRAPVRIGFERPRRELKDAEREKYPAGFIERSWTGAREGAWLAYTHHVRLPTLALHPVDRNLLVGDMLGIPSAPPDFSMGTDAVAEIGVDRLLHEFGVDQTIAPVLMTPAALWETKRWRPEHFAAVARHFLARGRPVLLAGAPNEVEECRSIAEAAPGTILVAGRTTLSELSGLMRRAAIVLANDSGPLHLAAALGRPVTSVFGPTNPLWVGPYGHPEAVLRAALPCSPCYLRDFSRCMNDHRCMRDVTPQQVITAMESTLLAGSVA